MLWLNLLITDEIQEPDWGSEDDQGAVLNKDTRTKYCDRSNNHGIELKCQLTRRIMEI